MEQQVVNLEEHPLQNQVILKRIFDLMESSATLEDWKNIRLVSKLWRSETLSRWRSKAVLDLVQETPFFEVPSVKLTPSGLLDLWQNPKDPYKLKERPYRNYKLENQTINLPFCKSNEKVSLFWSRVGPWMKSLILTKVNFETGDEGNSDKLLKFLIDKTPNLEHVTFDLVTLNRVGIVDGLILEESRLDLECTSVISFTCKESFGYEFSCFPNLKKVRLESGKPIELTYLGFQRMIDQNPVGNSKVTHLDMMSCIVSYNRGRTQRLTMENMKFPSLEHLSLNMNYPRNQYFRNDNRDNEFGRRMIANHRETLKELKTFCWIPPRFGGDWAIRYPMPVLSKLFIWGNCLDNLDFLRFTPNLTLLHIDLYGFEKKEEMNKLVENASFEWLVERVYIPKEDKVEANRLSGNLAGVVLSKLEYFQINYKVGSESVRALGEWMPNLKIFKGMLDSSTLPIVCEVWPKLEQLHCLFGSKIEDEDVFGVGHCGRFKKGVMDLKSLTSFHYNSECNRSSLGEHVQHAFLIMKQLTDLQICVSKNFSRDSEEALLTSHIQNVKIYRNYSENENHKDWKCCRDKGYLEDISTFFQLNDLDDLEEYDDLRSASDTDDL